MVGGFFLEVISISAKVRSGEDSIVLLDVYRKVHCEQLCCKLQSLIEFPFKIVNTILKVSRVWEFGWL